MRRLEIDILSSISNEDSISVSIKCNKSLIVELQKYSDLSDTIPPLLTKKSRRYSFVGVPIFFKKNIATCCLVLEPLGNIIHLGDYVVVEK